MFLTGAVMCHAVPAPGTYGLHQDHAQLPRRRHVAGQGGSAAPLLAYFQGYTKGGKSSRGVLYLLPYGQSKYLSTPEKVSATMSVRFASQGCENGPKVVLSPWHSRKLRAVSLSAMSTVSKRL